MDVCGFYDWAPAPAGTEITEEDVRALRAKQMTDDDWHIRVERKADSHHDMGIHELTVCQALATQELLGHETTREDVAVSVMKASLRHHLAPKHMHTITLHDDGPNEELYRSTLAEIGIKGDAADAAVARYLEGLSGDDLEKYLNVVFKTKPRKAGTPSKVTL